MKRDPIRTLSEIARVKSSIHPFNIIAMRDEILLPPKSGGG